MNDETNSSNTESEHVVTFDDVAIALRDVDIAIERTIRSDIDFWSLDGLRTVARRIDQRKAKGDLRGRLAALIDDVVAALVIESRNNARGHLADAAAKAACAELEKLGLRGKHKRGTVEGR